MWKYTPMLSIFATVAVLGCGADDPPPISVKDVPTPKDTGDIPRACVGVGARGECQDNTAVYCDLEAEELRRIDCGAIDRTCVIDTGRGAICEEPPTVEIDARGLCDGDTAKWLDESTNTIVQWDCEENGLSCAIDDCDIGAYCCSLTSEAPCGNLDFRGVCDGQTARWCGGSEVASLDCEAQGQACVVDQCAEGAFCCDVSASLDCNDVGGAIGICDGNVLRYCLDDEMQEVDCGTETCEFDTCFSDVAECCAP